MEVYIPGYGSKSPLSYHLLADYVQRLNPGLGQPEQDFCKAFLVMKGVRSLSLQLVSLSGMAGLAGPVWVQGSFMAECVAEGLKGAPITSICMGLAAGPQMPCVHSGTTLRLRLLQENGGQPVLCGEGQVSGKLRTTIQAGARDFRLFLSLVGTGEVAVGYGPGPHREGRRGSGQGEDKKQEQTREWKGRTCLRLGGGQEKAGRQWGKGRNPGGGSLRQS
jgi:hypothetical protein